MEDFKILEPGQRLRQMRKKLRLTQKDLSGENMSKNYISMFENGKRSINIINATYFADMINMKAKEKGVELNVTASYFVKTQNDIAREVCLEGLDKIKDNNIDKYEKYRELYKIIYISNEYELLNILAKSLKVKGKLLYRDKLYHCAITHFSKSLLYYSREDDLDGIHKCYLAMGKTYFMDGNYKTAITYYNLASLYGDEDSMLYYKALAYYKLGNYELSKSIIDKIIFKDERVLELENCISNID
ncbi:helix-turn-helix domain-containing protein [Schnuerera sp.]|uniref:helix-turn-helix domain-containing protein n=1 Tax=Schnuerera sp. TaxID=2794844 RepID=UPI002C61EBE5|nr:helix-turn-helix domain-containing protein [Schnuerera sp.]HSH36758.1 helix-turn-helix domain-containing protein [Schnuerera sp.]